jgi:two-component system sensor histidine kinase DegS
VTRNKQTGERLQRLNLILRTIRSVDQVLLEEKDRNQLIKGVCDSLVKTRGYYNAWIALLDKSGQFATFAEAGLGDNFLPMVEQLKKNGATECERRALAQSGAVVTSDPSTSCKDCPLAEGYRGRGGITARLKYRGKLYGILCASVPASMVTEDEESSLFEDVAGDIAFALFETELEEEREQLEKALRESENRYRTLFDSASDGMIVRDLKGNIIMANNAMAELTGYTIDELTRMNIAQFLSPSSLKTAMEKQRRRIEDKSEKPTQHYELQMIRKDGTEGTIDIVSSLLPDREQTPIMQVIARDITEQKNNRENLRAYASRAIMAQEEERKRIARELHDDTAQALASLGMDIDSLAKAKGTSSKNISGQLEALRDRTNDILLGIRSLSHALRPPMLEEFGLVRTLRGLADDLAEQHGMTVHFEVQGTPRRLSFDVELALFRIVQEALTNIGKHSQATEGRIELVFGPGKVNLMIRDNGLGFDLSTVTSNSAYSGRLGLIGMRERANLIHGTLTIWSEPGKGTSVILEVPRQAE